MTVEVDKCQLKQRVGWVDESDDVIWDQKENLDELIIWEMVKVCTQFSKVRSTIMIINKEYSVDFFSLWRWLRSGLIVAS